MMKNIDCCKPNWSNDLMQVLYGGLRKIRWYSHGHGKRGGARIIYYWAVSKEQLLLLLIYPKNVQDDLTSAQLKALRQIVETEYT